MIPIPFISDFVKETMSLTPQMVSDSVDALNYYATTLILACAAMAISAKQYFGKPIQCWVPTEFSKSWESYAEDYCFVANSYHLSSNQYLLESTGDERPDEISYYRWVPIMLALQALFFFLPNYIWSRLHKQTAINPKGFLSECDKINTLSGEEREKELDALAKYFLDTVAAFENRGLRSMTGLPLYTGFSATVLYVFIKYLYVFNIIAQIFLLDRFFGQSFLMWGYKTTWEILEGRPTAEQALFPRVIFCDFSVRALGHIRRNSVQCVIMLNLINEKLYLFMFFWFILIGTVTLLNCLYYVIMMLMPCCRTGLVKRDISRSNEIDAPTRREIKEFTNRCLHADGVLLLHFIKEHSGGRVAFELTNRLFATWRDGPQLASCDESTPLKGYEKEKEAESVEACKY